jgi:crotonobetainyl-CoA:carnitine CoA-transferase CaiB-like acyl-CoA transferase
MLNTASAWLNGGVMLGRTGNDHPSAAPDGVYEAADGHVIIATFNDREFYRLAEVLGHPEWITDPRFAKNGARVANRPQLKKAVQDIVIRKTRAEWVEILNAAKVSCGPINAMPEVASDPQILARDMIVTMPHDIFGEVRAVANPIKLSASPVSYRMAPPMMGEHTEEILKRELGLSDQQIEKLRREGAV